jgi:hypothetical protein
MDAASPKKKKAAAGKKKVRTVLRARAPDGARERGRAQAGGPT